MPTESKIVSNRGKEIDIILILIRNNVLNAIVSNPLVIVTRLPSVGIPHHSDLLAPYTGRFVVLTHPVSVLYHLFLSREARN
jgi:hypothetical protein